MKKLLVALVFIGSLLPLVAFAQQQPPTPQLLSIFPAGMQAGQSATVKIVEQTELEFADSLVFSHPGIVAKPKMRDKSRFYTPNLRLSEMNSKLLSAKMCRLEYMTFDQNANTV